MKSKRMVVAAVTGIVLGAAPLVPAHAGPALPPGWDISCEGSVCVAYEGDDVAYQANAWGAGFYGHVDLWGVGIPFRNGDTAQDPKISAGGSGAGTTCTEGWKHENGRYIHMGKACVTIPDT